MPEIQLAAVSKYYEQDKKRIAAVEDVNLSVKQGEFVFVTGSSGAGKTTLLKLISGEIETAMLPVPAATAAIAQSKGSVRDAIDLTTAWNDLDNGSQLIMSAVVARADFLAEHPQAVDAFLEEYEASVTYVKENPEEAGQLVADLGIAPSAAIAQKAIPQCNLVFLSGEDMKPAISGYYEVLYSIDPTAVGGKLPDDDIYYVP